MQVTIKESEGLIKCTFLSKIPFFSNLNFKCSLPSLLYDLHAKHTSTNTTVLEQISPKKVLLTCAPAELAYCPSLCLKSERLRLGK